MRTCGARQCSPPRSKGRNRLCLTSCFLNWRRHRWLPGGDVVEVSNYIAALDHGMARLRGGFPLCNRLLREMHALLMERGRGSDKGPGEFRRSQNWIGALVPAMPDSSRRHHTK